MFASTVTHSSLSALAQPDPQPFSQAEQHQQIEVANIARYLQAREAGKVGDALRSCAARTQASNIVTARFGKEYVERTTEVDLQDAMDDYTRCSANERVTFLDYFTLRDYKEAGYMRINAPMIHGRPTVESEQLRTRLTQAMHNLTYTVRPRDVPTSVLFRGTFLPRSVMQEMVRHPYYSPPAFFSVSSDKETAELFLLSPDECEETEVNILFEIVPHAASRAANLSAILRDGESEYLFGPHTTFKITSIDADPAGARGQPVVVRMQELNLD